MAELEDHFTVFVRLPFNRGTFIDPPPIAWSAAKERALWDTLSRQSQGAEFDWRVLADRFEVTQQFLLQQAAWLYERQLAQVKAQMRKVGNRSLTTPSPVPQSVTGSAVGGVTMKRLGSGGSRAPSRLSMQANAATLAKEEGSVPGTPARNRAALPVRTASGGPVMQQQQQQPHRAGSTTTSRPLSRQSSKDADLLITAPAPSRRGSIQNQFSRSPGQLNRVPASSDSDEEVVAQSRLISRRANPASLHRRTLSTRKDQSAPQTPIVSKPPGSDSEEDSHSFLPFAAAPTTSRRGSTQNNDPSATLRGGVLAPSGPSQAPYINRRTTSERIGQTSGAPPAPTEQKGAETRTASDRAAQAYRQAANPALADATNVNTATGRPVPSRISTQPTSSLPSSPRPTQLQSPSHTPIAAHPSRHVMYPANIAPPLSASQQAALAEAAGLTSRPPRSSRLTPPLRQSTNPNSNPNSNSNNPNPSQNNRTLHPSPHIQPTTTATNPNSRRTSYNQTPSLSSPYVLAHAHARATSGSDTSPSMGSSFSDLDDTSVTQSALEEALMSNLGTTAGTIGGGPGGYYGASTVGPGNIGNNGNNVNGGGGGGGGGGIGRISGISQALRSRYFDAVSNAGSESSGRNGNGNGRGNGNGNGNGNGQLGGGRGLGRRN